MISSSGNREQICEVTQLREAISTLLPCPERTRVSEATYNCVRGQRKHRDTEKVRTFKEEALRNNRISNTVNTWIFIHSRQVSVINPRVSNDNRSSVFSVPELLLPARSAKSHYQQSAWLYQADPTDSFTHQSTVAPKKEVSIYNFTTIKGLV